MCHVVRRDSSAIKYDRVEIAFFKILFYWKDWKQSEVGKVGNKQLEVKNNQRLETIRGWKHSEVENNQMLE